MEIPELHRVVGAVQPELQLLRLASSTAGVTVPLHCSGDFKHVLEGKAALGKLAFFNGESR